MQFLGFIIKPQWKFKHPAEAPGATERLSPALFALLRRQRPTSGARAPPNAGEGVERRDLTGSAGGNAKGYGRRRRQLGTANRALTI